MSADTPDPEQFVDDRHDDEPADPDPYGIVPDGFVERSSATTIAGALKEAEQADTKTHAREFPRCPNEDCHSIRIRKKPGHRTMDHKKDGAYKCTNCHEHFSEPAPPREEVMPGDQATFEEVRHR